MTLLTRRWSRAREGEGQFVLIVGEPGIGKSRLIEEFRARLAETPHTWVEWAASQLLQNTPLHPIAEWGRQRFGADAPAEQRLADLENTLRLIGLDPAEYAPLIAPLVDIPLPEERAAKFAPEELRRRQLAAMTAWCSRGSAVAAGRARLRGPALGRPDVARSHALAGRARRAGAAAPRRDDAAGVPPALEPCARTTASISLAPLDRAQVAPHGRRDRSRHALSDDMIDGVSERTGGVPLFVEEVTRLLLERGEQGGAQAIPPTLQQSLAARLDRLGEAREVAQIGAVLGRDFSYALLQRRVARPIDELRLQAALDRLAEADLLFVEARLRPPTYRFKHALIQDAAYESLLKSRRQALHRRAAETSARRRAPSPKRSPIISPKPASTISPSNGGARRATRRLRRSAFQEAIAHLGKAIEMADRAGATARRRPAARPLRTSD